jgi:hypothetical protein
VSDLTDALAELRSRIVRLEDHAQRGLIDRGELRRETAVLRTQVDSLIEAADDKVTRPELAQFIERLSLIQRIVFGAIGVILLAVLSSLVALVVRT